MNGNELFVCAGDMLKMIMMQRSSGSGYDRITMWVISIPAPFVVHTCSLSV
jgi:hypothetical protein